MLGHKAACSQATVQYVRGPSKPETVASSSRELVTSDFWLGMQAHKVHIFSPPDEGRASLNMNLTLVGCSRKYDVAKGFKPQVSGTRHAYLCPTCALAMECECSTSA